MVQAKDQVTLEVNVPILIKVMVDKKLRTHR